MICVNCGEDTDATASGFCPNCGAPQEGPSAGPIDPGLAQKSREHRSPVSRASGPLLTGSIAVDAALGFLGEISALGLIVYGIVLIIMSIGGGGWSQVHMVAVGSGAILTGVMMLLYTHQMRKRYPTFERGWQTGRNTWDWGGDQILTLLIGVAVSIVLFPLGMVICSVGVMGGPFGIVVAVILVYLVGLLARHISAANKRKRDPKP